MVNIICFAKRCKCRFYFRPTDCLIAAQQKSLIGNGKKSHFNFVLQKKEKPPTAVNDSSGTIPRWGKYYFNASRFCSL